MKCVGYAILPHKQYVACTLHLTVPCFCRGPSLREVECRPHMADASCPDPMYRFRVGCLGEAFGDLTATLGHR
jgi:hypothetical protein